MMMPPAVLADCSMRRTSTRSCNGRNAMDIVSRCSVIAFARVLSTLSERVPTLPHATAAETGRCSAGDEAAQRVGLELDLFDAILDQIADADDADQNTVADHRKMAEAMLSHARHQLAHRVLGDAGNDLARHQPVDGGRQQPSALLGQRMNDITLGE